MCGKSLIFCGFVATLVGTALTLWGCAKNAPPPTPVQEIAADSPEAQRGAKELRPGIWRYTTRGRIDRMPKSTGIARDLAIHHEALTAFYNREGKNVGMQVMVMDFPSIAAGVSLDGLKVGDVVVFDFDVDWASKDVWTVTRLKRLPHDTPLDLAAPPPEAPK